MASTSNGSDTERTEHQSSVPPTLFETSSSSACDRPVQRHQSFIHKLHAMCTNATHAHIIGFTEDGLSIKIGDSTGLGSVLYRYFMCRNYSTFIRQLNNYGFKTISFRWTAGGHVLAHPYFLRDRKDFLGAIFRKGTRGRRYKTRIIMEPENMDRYSVT